MKAAFFLFLMFFFAGLTACSEDQDPRPCIDPDLINPGVICPRIYEPVCGCDGVTYSNECLATNSGVLFFEEGECPGS